MSQKGGYQILDLKGTALTAGSASTIKGIYETLEGNYHKPVLVSGLVIGDTVYADAYVTFTVSESNYIGKAYGYNITITDDDEITVAAETTPIASATALGNVKVGDGLSITADGKLSVSQE